MCSIKKKINSFNQNLYYFQTWSVPINVPANKNVTRVNGIFNANDETLVLAWNTTKNGVNMVSFNFKRDIVTKTYILERLEASIAPGELPNSNLSQCTLLNCMI